MKIAKQIFNYLMFGQGLLWIGFSIFNFTNNTTHTVINFMMMINGVVFLICPLILRKVKIINIGIFIFLIVNLLLTLTDQMGFFDYFVLVLNIISIAALSFFIANKNPKQY